MLLNSNAPIGEIAASIGFGSSASFIRTFKKQFPQTPNAWRQLDTTEKSTLFAKLEISDENLELRNFS